MERKLFGWHSPALNKHMDIAIYGHWGAALLMIPTAAADFLEYERFDLIQSIQPFIDSGKFKVFSVNSINTESWLNKQMLPHHKAIRQNQFNEYIFNEVIPFIKNNSSWDTPIYVTGASFGALHSMNLYLKRPDLLNGVIAMSGIYDLSYYTDGFYNEDVYFNSPAQYIQNLNDSWFYEHFNRNGHIHILSGSGDYESPDSARYFSNILKMKGIENELDIWGHDMRHDWPTWRAMLPHYLGTRF